MALGLGVGSQDSSQSQEGGFIQKSFKMEKKLLMLLSELNLHQPVIQRYFP